MNFLTLFPKESLIPLCFLTISFHLFVSSSSFASFNKLTEDAKEVSLTKFQSALLFLSRETSIFSEVISNFLDKIDFSIVIEFAKKGTGSHILCLKPLPPMVIVDSSV